MPVFTIPTSLLWYVWWMPWKMASQADTKQWHTVTVMPALCPAVRLPPLFFRLCFVKEKKSKGESSFPPWFSTTTTRERERERERETGHTFILLLPFLCFTLHPIDGAPFILASWIDLLWPSENKKCPRLLNLVISISFNCLLACDSFYWYYFVPWTEKQMLPRLA